MSLLLMCVCIVVSVCVGVFGMVFDCSRLASVFVNVL